MLHKVLKVPSYEVVNSLLRMLSKSATFLDFQLSEGSVATYCRCGGKRIIAMSFGMKKTMASLPNGENSLRICVTF